MTHVYECRPRNFKQKFQNRILEDFRKVFRWWRNYLAVKIGFEILLPHVLFPSSWGFCGLIWLPPINRGLQRLGAVENWLRNVVLKTVDIIDVAFWCENGFEIEIFENFICLKHRKIFLFYLAVISYLIKRTLVENPSICWNFLIKFSKNFVKNFQSLKSIRIFNRRKEIILCHMAVTARNLRVYIRLVSRSVCVRSCN